MEPQAWEDLERADGGALRTVKDLSAGAAGGIAQVLLGMSCIFLNLGATEYYYTSSRELCLLSFCGDNVTCPCYSPSMCHYMSLYGRRMF